MEVLSILKEERIILNNYFKNSRIPFVALTDERIRMKTHLLTPLSGLGRLLLVAITSRYLRIRLHTTRNAVFTTIFIPQKAGYSNIYQMKANLVPKERNIPYPQLFSLIAGDDCLLLFTSPPSSANK